MPTSSYTRIVIGITAAVWFAVAWLTNQTLPTFALKTVSLTGTAITILFLLYERFIWKWKLVRLFTGKPLIAGTWRGELRSDYVAPGNTSAVPEVPVVLRIKQTNSSVFVTLFTDESYSVTEQGNFMKEDDGRWRLSWIYKNVPRPAVQDRSSEHRGVCDVHLTGRNGERLFGRYFTGRKTTGELDLAEWSQHSYGDADSAFAGTDFGQAQPFARA